MRTGKTFVLNSELGQPLSRGKETWYNLCTETQNLVQPLYWTRNNVCI